MSWFWWRKNNVPTLAERYTKLLKEGEENEEQQQQEQDAFGVDNSTGELDTVLELMLYVSSLIYTFSYVRQLARDEELEKEHLILAADEVAKLAGGDGIPDRKKIFEGRVNKDKITAAEVVEFVTANMKRLSDDDEVNSDMSVRAILGVSKLKNAYVSNFDDYFNKKSLVYAVTVNEDAKRIVVTFRGSVVGTRDWSQNIKALHSTMGTPRVLTDELGFDKDKVIKIHQGFKSYLFEECDPPYEVHQKYHEIKQDVLDLYTRHGCQGYDLYVTGHSLGGALSTLLAFELASSRKVAPHLEGRPVVNISFASPYVGNDVFNEAFQALERAGKVRHIRVSNQKDLVTVSPPTAGYTHVGVNLHLDPAEDKGYEVKYRGNRSMLWQWGFNPIRRHSLVDYWEHKCGIQDHIQNKSINDLYQDQTLTRDFAA